MKLEYSILEHLSNNDNGKFIDITFFDDDYGAIREALEELKGKNLILTDSTSGRDLEAFGITNNRKKSIRAKINTNGRAYFHSLKNLEKLKSGVRNNRKGWSLSYFLNF